MRAVPLLFVLALAVSHAPMAAERAGNISYREREAAKLMEQAVRCEEMGLEKTLRSARVLFRKVIERYPDTPQAAEARKRLAFLTGSHPENGEARALPGDAPIPEVELWRLPHWDGPEKDVRENAAPGTVPGLRPERRILNQC